MSSTRETATAVFERINRRRAESAATASGDGVSGGIPRHDVPGPDPVRVRVDEVLFGDPADPLARPPGPVGGGPSARPVAADAAADRFPRSATMRLILKHPALALGLGVPAAGLLLKSPTSRRLLGMAVRVGTGPELQQLLRLSAGVAAAGHPERPDPDRPPV